jgi:signal transduction histidine kinase
MTIRYFYYILLSFFFITGCHIFLPTKGMAQSVVLHAVQVLFPLWAAYKMMRTKTDRSGLLIGAALILLSLTDLNYFITMYALKLDPNMMIIDLATTVPYHLAYLLAGLGIILNFNRPKEVFQSWKFWTFHILGLVLAIIFVVLPMIKGHDGTHSPRYFYIMSSAIISSLFLMQTSIYAFISSRNVSQSLFSLGFFSYAITDWAIQVETLHRTLAVLSFNAFLWTLSSMLVSFPILFDKNSFKSFEVYRIDSLVSTMRFRLMIAMLIPLMFLGLTLNSSWYGVVIISFGLVFGCITITFAVQYLYDSVLDVSEILKKTSNKNFSDTDIALLIKKTPIEMREAIIDVMNDRITSERRETEVKVDLARKLHSMSAQVAHDIRSPLEVLKGLKHDLLVLPEGSRRSVQMCINRIEEITFILLRSSKDENPEALEEGLQSEELLSLTESIVLEKKIEFSSLESVAINSEFDNHSYGLFSKLRRGALKRVISNLLNNGVDALQDKPGSVNIKLFSSGRMNIIEVIDTGSGIPEEFKKNIFSKGFTSKTMGNGLGLSGAMEEVTSVGGRIDFESELGKGTVFRVSLPKSDPPSTFVKSLEIQNYSKIIILDDDLAFHEVWNQKFKLSYSGIVESFYSPKDLFSKYEVLPQNTLLLTDFELLDDTFDGIDVIQKFARTGDSVLATARSEEINIQQRCAQEGIKLVSKAVINYLDINSSPRNVVLIDDDKFIRISWMEHFKGRGVPFKSFSSIENFLKDAPAIEKESFIYIDSSLGNGIRGEIEGEKIHNLGFPNLYLATGYLKDDINKPHWIKGIYSKSPAML